LRAAAVKYAERIGDADFVHAIELFIREEQCHGEMLGKFLDLAGVGRVAANWGDSLFRAARYCLSNMEIWTTPVLMVETLALVYYNAIRRATRSTVLRNICGRILADEIPHLRFQCERLAIIICQRPRWALRLTLLAHRVGFLFVAVLVWVGHRRALRAGGYCWWGYWRAAWNRIEACWKLVDWPHKGPDRQHNDALSVHKSNVLRPSHRRLETNPLQ
jgi:hypothetical protein